MKIFVNWTSLKAALQGLEGLGLEAVLEDYLEAASIYDHVTSALTFGRARWAVPGSYSSPQPRILLTSPMTTTMGALENSGNVLRYEKRAAHDVLSQI
jgi:hypothetical protein